MGVFFLCFALSGLVSKLDRARQPAPLIRTTSRSFGRRPFRRPARKPLTTQHEAEHKAAMRAHLRPKKHTKPSKHTAGKTVFVFPALCFRGSGGKTPHSRLRPTLSQSWPFCRSLLSPDSVTESLESSLRNAGRLYRGGRFYKACTAPRTGFCSNLCPKGSSPSHTAGLEKRPGVASSPSLPLAIGFGL